jgi:peptidoglycan/LPS O-acetylase OafA/YrhL
LRIDAAQGRARRDTQRGPATAINPNLFTDEAGMGPADAVSGQSPSWLRSGRVPSLDGLRGVSIVLVLAAHLAPRRLSFAGDVGVDLFFLISGFIITLLLFREQERTDSISLKNFYLRRARRILPAYLAFLVGALVLTQADLLPIKPRKWIPALTYTVGFVRVPQALQHLWSLSTEEHFYLVWPVLLCLLPRRVALAGLAAVILLTPAVRVLVYLHFSDLVDGNLSTPTRMDGIAAGCFLAFVAWSGWCPAAIRPSTWRADVLALAAAVVCLVSRDLLYRLMREESYRAFYHSVYIVCLGLIVWVVLYHPTGLVGRIVNTRIAVGAGLVSYSLYLWQQIFCYGQADYWVFHFPANVCVAVACAVASYYLIETPFLRWRRGSARRKGVGSLFS